MAFTPLATITDLKTFRTAVRRASGSISTQESLILDPMLTDIIHSAITEVRTRLADRLNIRYQTEARSADSEIAEASNLIDISSLNIFDTATMTLRDGTHGLIALKSPAEFDGLRTLYSTTMLANALFARVVNVKADNNKLQIETYRGMNVASPGALTLVYLRNPSQATADATKVDLPEDVVPLAKDVAVVMVSEVLKKSPPADVAARVQELRGGASA